MHKKVTINYKIAFIYTIAFTLFIHYGFGQEEQKDHQELDKLMEEIKDNTPGNDREPVIATFKTTRIANGHSIENTKKGVLDFRINHRFGAINEGLKEFFGLDNAVTRIAFDYGLSDILSIGIGRSTHLKEYDGYLKLRILKQNTAGSMPLSLSYMGSASVISQRLLAPQGYEYLFSYRMAYINQLILARKFSNAISVQLMPTHIHYNFVDFRDEPNDLLAIGIGGRIKLTNRVSFTGEYYPIVGRKLRNTKNALTLGVDIETGGHVFQLMVSNSTGVTERSVIGQTYDSWSKGQLHFGFNISRVFTIVKPKEFRQ